MISLWGMPGSGKSYWGVQLASQLHYGFIDLDSEIEKHLGDSIQEIIKNKGEAFFRKAESEVLKGLLSEGKVERVLATGGGTPCFSNNLQLLKQNTLSIYLKVSESLLTENLKDEYHKRPLFSGEDNLLSQIIAMKTKREAFYEQADILLEAPLNVEKFKSVIPR